MEAVKLAPVCTCGKQSRHIQMLTFSYFYCDACKDEVKELPKATPVVNKVQEALDAMGNAFSNKAVPANWISVGSSNSQLPPGYVAFKGEAVICCMCGLEHGTLAQDLPADPSKRVGLALFNWTHHYFACLQCGAFDSSSRILDTGGVLVYIKVRGWV